jgi:DNA-binding Lrp family transcriptional regulator
VHALHGLSQPVKVIGVPTKMTAMPLDAIDHRLLALLKDDARTPLVTLAKRIGLSRSAAQERLKRLERDGVIEKYTVRLAAPTIPGVQAWFAVRFAQGFSCNDVIDALAALPEVRLCHSVAGEIDLLILVECEHVARISELREAILMLKGVDGVTTTMVLNTPLDRR